MQLKSELRKELLQRRRAVVGKSEKDTAIFTKLIALPEFEKAELVLTYVSTGHEVDTRQLIGYCFEKGIAAAVPGIVDEQMRFFELRSDFTLGEAVLQFGTGSRQLCVVPALAYNAGGFRIGYGGGYYDRFLKDYTGLKVGICYGEFVCDLPVEEHDVGVDVLLTDTNR